MMQQNQSRSHTTPGLFPPSSSSRCGNLASPLWRERFSACTAASASALFSSGLGHLGGRRFAGIFNLSGRYLANAHGASYRVCRSPFTLWSSRHEPSLASLAVRGN